MGKGYYQRLNIRKKLFVSFLTVSLIPVIILSIIHYCLSYLSIRSQIDNRANDYSSSISIQMNSEYESFKATLNSYVYDDELLAIISTLKNSKVDYNQLYLYDNDMLISMQSKFPLVEQVAVIPNLALQSKSYTEKLNEIITSEINDNDENKSIFDKCGRYNFFLDKKWYVVSSVRDLYKNREVARLVVVINADKLFNSIFGQQLNNIGIIIADNNGRNVACFSEGLVTTGIIPISIIENAKSELIRYNGIRYLYRGTLLDAENLILYTIIPYDDVDRQTANLLRVLLGFVAIVGSLIILAASLIARNFSRRLYQIINQMKSVSNGDWLRKNIDSDSDEIGQLSRAFEDMLLNMERLINDVYQAQINEKKLEYSALVAQINPHFLYNCLDNLNWYAIMRGDDHSSHLITDMSNYYRTCLNKGNKHITIVDELKNADAYMSLQLELHENRFIYEKDVEDDIGDFITINLILQPILENAIKYGVDRESTTEDVKHLIKLSAKKYGDDIIFTVFNSGIPITESLAISALESQGKGYGLKNVNNRIQLYFGEEYGITISGVKDGTECRVRIPQRTIAEGGENNE